MSEIWSILALVAGFTALEALRRVRPEALLFTAGWWGRLRLRSSEHRAVTIRDGGVIMLGSLLPGALTVLAEPWPLRLEAEGVQALPAHWIPPAVPEARPGWTATYAELAEVRARGATLELPDGRVLATSSGGAARWWSQLLGELAALPPEERTNAIEAALASTLDRAEVERRRLELHAATWPLRLVALLLTLFVFILLPLVPLAQLHVLPIQLLGGYLILILSAQITYWMAHRRLQRERFWDRLLHVLLMPVYPAYVLQGPAQLAVEHLGHLHPLGLALAGGVVRSRDGISLARRVLAGLRASPPPAPPPTSTTTELLEAFIEQAGLQPGDLQATPREWSKGASAWCTYCGQQLTASEGVCPDCGGALAPRSEEGTS